MRRAVLARLVIGEALIDRARADETFGGDEFIRPAADHLGHLREGIGLGDALGHDRRREGGAFAERVGKQRKRPLQPELDGLVVGRRELVGRREERLAEGVALAPALDAGDAIPREHRASVVEFEARTEHDLPQFAVILGRCALGHLRRRAVAVVLTVKRVEDEESVVARHRRRRPHGIEHGKIRLRREFHHPLFGAERQGRGRERRRGKRCRGGGFQEISSAHGGVSFRPFDSTSRSHALKAFVERQRNDLISE